MIVFGEAFMQQALVACWVAATCALLWRRARRPAMSRFAVAWLLYAVLLLGAGLLKERNERPVPDPTVTFFLAIILACTIGLTALMSDAIRALAGRPAPWKTTAWRVGGASALGAVISIGTSGLVIEMQSAGEQVYLQGASRLFIAAGFGLAGWQALAARRERPQQFGLMAVAIGMFALGVRIIAGAAAGVVSLEFTALVTRLGSSLTFLQLAGTLVGGLGTLQGLLGDEREAALGRLRAAGPLQVVDGGGTGDLAAAIDGSADAIAMLDAAGALRRWNAAFAVRARAEGPAPYVGAPLTMWAPSSQRDAWRAAIRIAARGLPQSVTPEPSAATLGRDDFRVVPVRADDEIVAVLATIFDASDRLRRDAESAREDRLTTLSSFARGLAQEWHGTLAEMLTHAEIAFDVADDPSGVRRELTALRDAAVRGRQFGDQLQHVARRILARPRPLDVGLGVADWQPRLAERLGPNLRLAVSVAGAPSTVMVDPARMEEVLATLLHYARRSLADGSTVQLTVRATEAAGGTRVGGVPLPAGRFVIVAVDVPDAGISPADADRLFEPFFDPPTRAGGLELAAAHGIVRQSGGTLAVRSSPGAGTTFEVWLPASADPAVTSDTYEVAG